MIVDKTPRKWDDAVVTIPTVSVIIPYFNAAQTIGRAIESVLAQTYSDFELLVIDDASPEELPTEVQQICSNKVFLKRHEMNRGAAAARNTGIDMSRGRYVAFLDADDCWHAEKLAEQLETLSKTGSKGCVCGFIIHREESNNIEYFSSSPLQPLSNELVWGCRLGPGSTLVCERECFHTVGFFDESLLRLEDWDWLLRFAEKYDLGYVPSVLCDVYVSKSGRAADQIAVYEATRRVRKKHLKSIAQFGLSKQLQFLSSLELEKAATLYRNGKKIGAAFHVCHATCLWPFRNRRFFKRIFACVFD